MNRFRLILISTCLLLGLVAPISYVSATTADINYDQLLEKKKTKFEEKVKTFSAKKQAKFQKKLDKLEHKLNKKNAPEDISDGVRTGLIIVAVGAIIALLGLSGVADILITIGLVVLLIGLILWLLDA